MIRYSHKCIWVTAFAGLMPVDNAFAQDRASKSTETMRGLSNTTRNSEKLNGKAITFDSDEIQLHGKANEIIIPAVNER